MEKKGKTKGKAWAGIQPIIIGGKTGGIEGARGI